GAVPVAAVAILAVVLFGRGPASPVVSLTPGEMHAQTYVQQHALAIAADPLADATALHAIGTLSLRADREAHGVH
ncbi:MAG: hypothetical protein HUU35_11015, partial [Armatimonadetes bacterium]|nr:hypothetical protein [Armatimonadota bacterium]